MRVTDWRISGKSSPSGTAMPSSRDCCCMLTLRLLRCPVAVIPAKAGIHEHRAESMDPGFFRSDDYDGSNGTHLVLGSRRRLEPLGQPRLGDVAVERHVGKRPRQDLAHGDELLEIDAGLEPHAFQ